MPDLFSEQRLQQTKKKQKKQTTYLEEVQKNKIQINEKLKTTYAHNLSHW